MLAAILIVGLWYVQRLQADIETIGRQIQNRHSETAATSQTNTVDFGDVLLAEDVDKIKRAVQELSEKFRELSDRVRRLADNSERLPAGARTAPWQADSMEKEHKILQHEQIAMLETVLNDRTKYDKICAKGTTVQVQDLIRTNPAYRIAESTNVQCGGTRCKIEAVLLAGVEQHENDLFEVKFAMDRVSELPRRLESRTELSGEPGRFKLHSGYAKGQGPAKSSFYRTRIAHTRRVVVNGHVIYNPICLIN